MFKIFIEKIAKDLKITKSLPVTSMKFFYILSISGLLLLKAGGGFAQTTFNGELFAHFASPVGATFRLFHQGQLVALNTDGYIDFGDLSYNSNIGLWVPSAMCSNPFTYCYRLTVNMEPFGVMGDFDLNLNYVNTNNPNQNFGFPYNLRHGLGRKVAMTLKSCETLPGANGAFDCFDVLNLGGPSNVTYAVLLDHINTYLGGVGENNTTNYYQMEFFVYTFGSNPAVWSVGGQPAEAFTDLDHSGDYDGTLTVTVTYN